MSELIVEVNTRTLPDTSPLVTPQGGLVYVTPPLDADYWVLRVPVSPTQSLVAFPKFGVIGIGFQQEEDWNCNLPSTCPAEEIFAHIAHNKGDDHIPDSRCIAAIVRLQQTLKETAP